MAGTITKLENEYIIGMRMGNPTEHVTLVFEKDVDRCSVMLQTISGSAMMTFTTADMFMFIHQFLMSTNEHMEKSPLSKQVARTEKPNGM